MFIAGLGGIECEDDELRFIERGRLDSARGIFRPQAESGSRIGFDMKSNEDTHVSPESQAPIERPLDLTECLGYIGLF